jgi:hypothetical protein
MRVLGISIAQTMTVIMEQPAKRKYNADEELASRTGVVNATKKLVI